MQSKQKRHLLIIGPPRAGTTLLATMVGVHSQVAMLIEDRSMAVTRLAGKPVAGNKLCVPNQIEISRRPADEVRGRLWRRFVRPWSRPRPAIGDYLQLEHPRLIAILRDGNDVITSIMSRGHQTFEEASSRWCRAVEIVRALREAVYPDTLVVSYERLVEDPRQQMHRVCRYLGLPFEEEMLEAASWNPIYPAERIDPGRARSVWNRGIDHGVAEKCPEAWAVYRDLIRTECAADERVPASAGPSSSG